MASEMLHAVTAAVKAAAACDSQSNCLSDAHLICFWLPACQELIPELSAAVEGAGLKWSDFKVTDNSCKPHPPVKSLVRVRQRQPVGVV